MTFAQFGLDYPQSYHQKRFAFPGENRPKPSQLIGFKKPNWAK